MSETTTNTFTFFRSDKGVLCCSRITLRGKELLYPVRSLQPTKEKPYLQYVPSYAKYLWREQYMELKQEYIGQYETCVNVSWDDFEDRKRGIYRDVERKVQALLAQHQDCQDIRRVVLPPPKPGRKRTRLVYAVPDVVRQWVEQIGKEFTFYKSQYRRLCVYKQGKHYSVRDTAQCLSLKDWLKSRVDMRYIATIVQKVYETHKHITEVWYVTVKEGKDGMKRLSFL